MAKMGANRDTGTVACIGGARLVTIAPLVGPDLACVNLGWIGSQSRRVDILLVPEAACCLRC